MLPTSFRPYHSKLKQPIIKKTANIWEYKVGINAIIGNFVCV